jgi:hypothetical protein
MAIEMSLDRRAALAWVAAAGIAAGMPLPTGMARAQQRRLYLGAKESGGSFFFSGFTAETGELFARPMAGRGHGVALHPTRREAVMFARRPGSFAVVVTLPAGQPVATVSAIDGRSFNGHGAFSADGALLFATESDYAEEAGLLSIFDATDGYRRIGAAPTRGLDPHEVRLMPDGRTLVVANGGLVMDETARGLKLNVPTMDPSLVYLDGRDGSMLRQVRLPPSLHQLSIRHLAIGAGGTVAAAMQYEGPAGDLVPLVALDRGAGELQLLDAPAERLRRLKNYCGSAAVDSAGRVLAASAPRGGVIAFWDLAEDGAFVGLAEVADGCGIAPAEAPGVFIASSGLGGVFSLDPRSGTGGAGLPGIAAADHWDNHLSAAAL